MLKRLTEKEFRRYQTLETRQYRGKLTEEEREEMDALSLKLSPHQREVIQHIKIRRGAK